MTLNYISTQASNLFIEKQFVPGTFHAPNNCGKPGSEDNGKL